jgi:hypothetical protein
VELAVSYSDEPDSLLAAREPVVFKSTNPLIIVKRSKSAVDDLDYSPSDEYLYPEFDVVINKAYKDFIANFSVIVHKDGKLTVGRFASLEKDFEASKRKVYQGVLDVYLQKSLSISPGSTLGIPHATEVMLHVKGIEN